MCLQRAKRKSMTMDVEAAAVMRSLRGEEWESNVYRMY
jgi:hypothetical protein